MCCQKFLYVGLHLCSYIDWWTGCWVCIVKFYIHNKLSKLMLSSLLIVYTYVFLSHTPHTFTVREEGLLKLWGGADAAVLRHSSASTS